MWSAVSWEKGARPVSEERALTAPLMSPTASFASTLRASFPETFDGAPSFLRVFFLELEACRSIGVELEFSCFFSFAVRLALDGLSLSPKSNGLSLSPECCMLAALSKAFSLSHVQHSEGVPKDYPRFLNSTYGILHSRRPFH